MPFKDNELNEEDKHIFDKSYIYFHTNIFESTLK